MTDFSPARLVRSPIIWAAIVAALVICAALYGQNERENARLQYERERVAAEQAEERRARESELRVERERQRVLDEIRAQKDAEEEQRQQAIAVRQSEVSKKQFVADERYVTPQQATYQNYQLQQDQWRRDLDDRRQRIEDERSLQKARDEVERQKRYLQQREYEEQAARARRDAAARYGR